MAEQNIYEYDGYVMPPLYKGEITSEILKKKEENRKEVEKKKLELLKKLGRI